MTETSITGTGFDCSAGVHTTAGDSPHCITCGVDTSAKPDIAPQEKIVQIACAANGVFALTSKGRLFLRMAMEWHKIALPNFKE